MKRSLLYLALMLFVAPAAMAQAPQQLNYQAIVRDGSGNPLPANTVVGLRFEIHQGSATGTVVYTETSTATTNQFGLITYQIGSTANLASVSWSSGSEFLQVEVDPTGGANYVDMGVSQLLSVPYALFSGNATSGPIGPTGVQGPGGNNGVTGSTGPTGVGIQGPTGPQGIPGVAGATGAPGVAGAQGPAGSNGAVGATGPQGPAGANGAQGNAGAQGPIGATGVQGAQGIQGPSGPQGIQGAVGASGPQGATGNAGVAGVQGPQGIQGPTGLQGPQGTAGVTGPQGTAGNQGVAGSQGSQGAQGPTGLQGTQGVAGATGPQGITGNNGAAGPQGPQGIQGVTGAQGAQGAQGVAGATGAQGTQGTQGPTGSQGAQGVAGPTGLQGAQGAAGSTGVQGAQGAQGPSGVQGAQGVAGTTGAQGIQGPTGNAGTTGAQGVQGPQGIQGNTGAAGANGATGSAGPTGAQGAQGNAGATGAAGSVGPTGAQGAQGSQGPQGFQGLQGLPGSAGATGPTGGNGAAGATGPSGSNGAAGPTGASGLLTAGTTAGNTTYWNGTTWVTNSSNIFNDGASIGIGTASPAQKLDVYGNIAMDGRQAFDDFGDGWLRLNQNGDYSSGTYTPGFLRGDGGIASGGLGSLGNGTITATGVINSNVGFTISNGAASGNFLRGNGADFVSSTIQASDLSNAISGSLNYVAKFTGPNSLGNSTITDNGSTVVLYPPTYTYFASGTVYAQNQIIARGGLYNDAAGSLLLSGGTSGVTQWASSYLQGDNGGVIELGGNNTTAGVGTPYIDFHYGTGSAQDYNVRIINDGNNFIDFNSAGGGMGRFAYWPINSGLPAPGVENGYWWASDYWSYNETVWLDVMNDLDAIDNMKPKSKLDAHTGQYVMEIDRATLPDAVTDRGKTKFSSPENTAISLTNAVSLAWGGIRELRAETKTRDEGVEARLARVENLLTQLTGKSLGEMEFKATATAYKGLQNYVIMDARISPKSNIVIEGLSDYTIVDQGEGTFCIRFSNPPAEDIKFIYSAKF